MWPSPKIQRVVKDWFATLLDNARGAPPTRNAICRKRAAAEARRGCVPASRRRAPVKEEHAGPCGTDAANTFIVTMVFKTAMKKESIAAPRIAIFVARG